MNEITVDEVDGSGRPVVDVREQWEWDEGHVPGAIHIPLAEVVERFSEIPDEAAIICKAGGRSARAATYLESQGLSVVNVAGGTDAWIAAGKPVD